MSKRTETQTVVNGLAAKLGIKGSVTPANLASDQFQTFLDNMATRDDVGFVDYNHGGAAQTTVADTYLALTNDGTGAATNTTHLPSGVTSMLAANQVVVSQLKLGDWFVIRATFDVTPVTNNQSVDIRYTLGTGGSTYTIGGFAGQLRQGAGVLESFSKTDFIYIGDANTKDNPIGIEVRTSGPASVQNRGFSIGVIGSST